MKAKKDSKKRKSPHHVSQDRVLQRTQVYLMHNVPYFWKNKFGISDHVKRRQKNVSETTDGVVFAVFAPELEFGYELEQFVHGAYAFLNANVKKGSGRTEWFYTFNPVVFCLCIAVYLFTGYTLPWWAYALCFFSPFVWLDGLLWLLVFSCLRLVIIAAFVLACIYMFAHL